MTDRVQRTRSHIPAEEDRPMMTDADTLWAALVQWQPATAAALADHLRGMPSDWPLRELNVGRLDAALALPPGAKGEQYPDRAPEVAPYAEIASLDDCPACGEAQGSCRYHEGYSAGHHEAGQAQRDAVKARPNISLREFMSWQTDVAEAEDRGERAPELPAARDLRDRITQALLTTPRHGWTYEPGQEMWNHHASDTPGHNYAISCPLCANDVDTLADAVLAVLTAPTSPAPAATTPCSAPDVCADGELCDRHETERAHAEDDHTFCGMTCEVAFPTEMLRNGIIAGGIPGTAGMLDELLRRAATPDAKRHRAEETAEVLAELNRTRAESEKRRVRMAAAEADLLDIRGALSPNGFPRRVPMELGETIAPVIEWLLDERDELKERVSELGQPTIEARRDAIRNSYHELAAQAREDRDYEGEHAALKRLERREAEWAAEDARTSEPRPGRHPRTLAERLRTERDELKKQLADLGRALNATITDRDRAQEEADKLAYAIAPVEVIGEHSGGNCPWQNARDLITPAAAVDKLRAALEDCRPKQHNEETAAHAAEGSSPR